MSTTQEGLQQKELKEVLTGMLCNIIEKPQHIGVREIHGKDSSLFEVELIQLEKTDAGRVMGKNGKTAAALRQLLRAAAGIRGKHCELRFLQPEK